MPDCIQCQYLDRSSSTCSIKFPRGRPLRACVKAINLDYKKLVKPHYRVVEIGCGSWSPIWDYCKSKSIQWDGIDILKEYMGKPTIATNIGSVGNIPFDDNSFDIVIGNQTMEHWEENGVHLLKGLSEVFRVLKPGGQMLMNVPIHYHGSPLFVKGKLDKLNELLKNFANNIKFEIWRAPSKPLPKIRYLQSRFWYSGLRNKTAYILDIAALKNADIPVPYFDKDTSKFKRRMNNIFEFGLLYYPTLLNQSFSKWHLK